MNCAEASKRGQQAEACDVLCSFMRPSLVIFWHAAGSHLFLKLVHFCSSSYIKAMKLLLLEPVVQTLFLYRDAALIAFFSLTMSGAERYNSPCLVLPVCYEFQLSGQ